MCYDLQLPSVVLNILWHKSTSYVQCTVNVKLHVRNEYLRLPSVTVIYNKIEQFIMIKGLCLFSMLSTRIRCVYEQSRLRYYTIMYNYTVNIAIAHLNRATEKQTTLQTISAIWPTNRPRTRG